MAAEKKNEATEQFWLAFRTATQTPVNDYDVVSFADGSSLATQLAELVVSGKKRATAGLLRQFGPDGEPLRLVEASNQPKVWSLFCAASAKLGSDEWLSSGDSNGSP